MKINKKHLHSLIKKQLVSEEIGKMQSVVKQKQIKEEIDNAQATQQLNLLSKIADRLDKLTLDTIVSGLADVDVSIDALTAALTGASSFALGTRQSYLGRGARAKKVQHAPDDPVPKKDPTDELGEGFYPTNGGGGLGIGTPDTANAGEMSGGVGAPTLGWDEIDSIKENVREELMNVLRDYVNNLSDAYELLSVITNDVEDELSQRGYVQNGDELRAFLPLQERSKRSKSDSPKQRARVRVQAQKLKTKGKTRK